MFDLSGAEVGFLKGGDQPKSTRRKTYMKNSTSLAKRGGRSLPSLDPHLYPYSTFSLSKNRGGRLARHCRVYSSTKKVGCGFRRRLLYISPPSCVVNPRPICCVADTTEASGIITEIAEVPRGGVGLQQ